MYTPQCYGASLVIWEQCYLLPDMTKYVPPNPSHTDIQLTYPKRDISLS